MGNQTVVIEPKTTVKHPYPLQAGETVVVKIHVENQSNSLDRFQLGFTDLPASYYTVCDPKNQVQSGQIPTLISLDLGPDQHETIQVNIHPPEEVTAGIHPLTLQMKFANHPESAWTETIHFQITPAPDLEILLQPSQGQVQHGVGLYQLLLANHSNLTRALTIQAKSVKREKGCTYMIEPSVVRLKPGAEANVDLTVQPGRWWNRPWFGKARQIKFEIGLLDHEGLPLPQHLPQGTLAWEPYPQSLRLRVLVLLILATGSAGSGLVWTLFFRQPVPEITELGSVQAQDATTQNQAIRLNWSIKHAKQLDKLILARHGIKGPGQIKSYSFKSGIPTELQRQTPDQQQDFCEFQEDRKTTSLVCKGILTQIPDANVYRFQLQTFGRNNSNGPSDTQTTNPIAIEPNPRPQIVQFYSPNTTYKSDSTKASSSPPASNASTTTVAAGMHQDGNPILLNWDITNPSQIRELQVLVLAAKDASAGKLQRYSLQAGKLPQPLANFCTLKQTLVCRNIPTIASKPGQYVFKLTAISQQGEQLLSSTKLTGPILSISKPLRIARFQIHGQEAPAKYVLDLDQSNSQPNLVLSWQVEGGNNPKVEILPVPGIIPRQGKVTLKLNPLVQQSALTLQATDASGKQVKRSVAIEIKNSNLLAQKQSSSIEPILPKPSSQTSAKTSPSVVTPSSTPTPQVPKSLVLRQTPVKPAAVSKAAIPKPQPKRQTIPQTSDQSLEEAAVVIRGLVLARQRGKIIPNGMTWRKTQDAITLLRRGHSRAEAARLSGVPLWKLNTLVTLGENPNP